MSSVSSGWPSTLKTWPEHGVADRHGDAPAGVAHRGSPDQAVGRLHADAAHPALADLLGHLGRDGDLGALELEVHLDGVVDLGQGVGWELDVDDRTGDGDDPALLQRWPSAVGAAVRWWSWGQAPFDWRSASAPPTISMISVVMASWRARFMMRLSVRISSSALSLAAAIARCWAVKKEAAPSSRAVKISDSTAWGASSASSVSTSGSNSV